MPPVQTLDRLPISRELIDVLIRVGLIATLAIWCFDIFRPFLHLMLWALILAITMHPLHAKLGTKLGGRNGLASIVLVAIALSLILAPIYLLGESMTESVPGFVERIKSGDFQIPPPAESVAAWPVIGKPLYGYWVQAAADLTSLAHKLAPQLKDVSLTVLGTLASAASRSCCSSAR